MSVAFGHSSPPGVIKRLPYPPQLDLPNQDSIRADLAIFFGPNADRYLEVYAGMRFPGKGKWNWAAFLLTFVWFFYRKMYAYGAVILFAPPLIAYLFGMTGGGGWAAMWIMSARSSMRLYVDRALDRIAKADQLGLTGADRFDYLQRAGGVSLTAGVFAGVIYALLVGLVAAAVLARHHVGH